MKCELADQTSSSLKAVNQRSIKAQTYLTIWWRYWNWYWAN